MKIELEIEDKHIEKDADITDLHSLLCAVVNGEGGAKRVSEALLDHEDGLLRVLEASTDEEIYGVIHEDSEIERLFIADAADETLQEELEDRGFTVTKDLPIEAALLEARGREFPPNIARVLSALSGAFVADKYPAETVEESLQQSIWRKTA